MTTEEEDWECPNCHQVPYLGEGMDVPEHKLCWPCASDEVTRLRAEIEVNNERWSKHSNELALMALDGAQPGISAAEMKVHLNAALASVEELEVQNKRIMEAFEKLRDASSDVVICQYCGAIWGADEPCEDDCTFLAVLALAFPREPAPDEEEGN